MASSTAGMPLSVSSTCHHWLGVEAVVISFNSAGEGCASFYFIIYILRHLTVFHRAPQCYGFLLDRGRRGKCRWGSRREHLQSSVVSRRRQELHCLSDKYSFRVITLFQPYNDINKLGIQGITWVRTNNWIFHCWEMQHKSDLMSCHLWSQHYHAIRW